ncbi:MAG: hypothetical protein K0V04_31165 [Deltaproteobacteria bacterium]|nr:hypothetical protein [Deltaproteobacteria bacterium]
MPSRLRAHTIAAADPTAAAREAAHAVFADAPRGRPSLVMIASWGAHPGLRPSPWAVEGVLQALSDAGLRGHGDVLGEARLTDPLHTRLAAHDYDPVAAQELIALHPARSRRALRIPRAWLGRNLCLVLPCIHRQRERTTPADWSGPIGSALIQLATRCGGASVRDPMGTMTRTIADVFAHVSVVIDASWWAPLQPAEEAAPVLLSPERVLSLQLASPVTTEASIDPRQLDTWLGAQLGLPLRRPSSGPRAEGSAARTPWPKLPRAMPRAQGLAGKSVAGLWRRPGRAPTRATALPPAVPGGLAKLWDEYERDTVTP